MRSSLCFLQNKGVFLVQRPLLSFALTEMFSMHELMIKGEQQRIQDEITDVLIGFNGKLKQETSLHVLNNLKLLKRHDDFQIVLDEMFKITDLYVEQCFLCIMILCPDLIKTVKYPAFSQTPKELLERVKNEWPLDPGEVDSVLLWTLVMYKNPQKTKETKEILTKPNVMTSLLLEKLSFLDPQFVTEMPQLLLYLKTLQEPLILKILANLTTITVFQMEIEGDEEILDLLFRSLSKKHLQLMALGVLLNLCDGSNSFCLLTANKVAEIIGNLTKSMEFAVSAVSSTLFALILDYLPKYLVKMHSKSAQKGIQKMSLVENNMEYYESLGEKLRSFDSKSL